MRMNLKNKAGDSGISYSDYWNDLVMLASGDLANDDNVKTALVVYRELTGQILLHASDFKNAGIAQDVILSELDMVELRLVDITKMDYFDQTVDQNVVDEIAQNIEDCRKTIDVVFAVD